MTAPGNARRHGPSIGSWIADPTKPIAIVDKTGKNMVFYPAQRPKTPVVSTGTFSSANTSPNKLFSSLATSVTESENDRSDTSTQGMLVQSPANLMMSGLFGNGSNLERVFAAPVVGPPEAFYPWRTVDLNGNIVEADDDYDDDDEDELDANLNIHDFIDFGEGSVSETDSNEMAFATVSNKRFYLYLSLMAITSPLILDTVMQLLATQWHSAETSCAYKPLAAWAKVPVLRPSKVAICFKPTSLSRR